MSYGFKIKKGQGTNSWFSSLIAILRLIACAVQVFFFLVSLHIEENNCYPSLEVFQTSLDGALGNLGQ